MGSYQTINTAGAERMVVIPEAEYLRLVAAEEDLADTIAALDAKAGRDGGTAQMVDGALLHAMIAAETPLAGAIKFRGVRLTALHDATGLSVSYISDLSKARSRGSVEAWRKLAAALDAPLDLLTATDD